MNANAAPDQGPLLGSIRAYFNTRPDHALMPPGTTSGASWRSEAAVSEHDVHGTAVG